MSGHGKKATKRGTLTSWRRHREGLVRTQKRPTERGALTSWRRHREGLVSTRKEINRSRCLTNWRRHREGLVSTQKAIDRARCTHILETASGGTCQDTERNRPSKAYSHPGDGIGRDLSGHRKKSTEQGILTSWRQHQEGLVRTQEKSTERGVLTGWRRHREGLVDTGKIDRARCTHKLETASGGTYQDTERNRLSEARSLSGDSRRRALSGHRKRSTDRGALTNWRRQREGLVRTQKKTARSRHTHSLETASGGTCQDTERDRPTEAHSPTGDGRGSDLSGHRKKSTDRGALTSWRRQTEGLVRTQKEIDRPRRTHFLETASGGTCQGTEETDRARRTHKLETASGGTCQVTERNRPTEVHSLTEDDRGRDLSRHRKKPTEQGALTSWRQQREGLVRT